MTTKKKIAAAVAGVAVVAAASTVAITATSTSTSTDTTTTTTTEPAAVPGTVVPDSSYVLTYTVTDPTGIRPAMTESIGASKARCNGFRKSLLAVVGVSGASIAPVGMVVSSVGTCAPDSHSFTTDTTTTTVPQ